MSSVEICLKLDSLFSNASQSSVSHDDIKWRLIIFLSLDYSQSRREGGREGCLRAVRPTGGIPPPPHLPSSSASFILPKGRSVCWAQSVCAQPCPRREKVKSWPQKPLPHHKATVSPYQFLSSGKISVFLVNNIGMLLPSEQYIIGGKYSEK